MESDTCESAAENGQIKTLKWLRSTRSQDPPCPWNGSTCAYAAKNGQIETLKWLRFQNPPCPWNGSLRRLRTLLVYYDQ